MVAGTNGRTGSFDANARSSEVRKFENQKPQRIKGPHTWGNDVTPTERSNSRQGGSSIGLKGGMKTGRTDTGGCIGYCETYGRDWTGAKGPRFSWADSPGRQRNRRIDIAQQRLGRSGGGLADKRTN